tara:strand:+ start:102 stop:266 length:165 start_codon:yes stop_codon:yes gene_type:complete
LNAKLIKLIRKAGGPELTKAIIQDVKKQWKKMTPEEQRKARKELKRLVGAKSSG